MLGLKRRTKVEGWALDVTNADEATDSSFIQRLGENNRLWVVALMVLVLVSAFLIRHSKQMDSRKNEDLYKPPPARLVLGTYGDKLHRQFAADFLRANSAAIEAHFAEGRFIVVVAGDTGADDIEHMSRMAAERNSSKFRNRVVVEVYQRRSASGRDVLVCTTKWETDSYGYVPRFVRAK